MTNPILSPSESRSIANFRLRTAFGIHNAFTSEDEEYVKAFRNRTIQLMCLSQEKWEHVARFASDAARNLIQHGLEGEHQAKNREYRAIHITSLVQILTLKVVRLMIFKRGGEDPVDDSDLLTLARSITQVWVDSKRKLDDLPRFEDNMELRSSLVAAFAAHEHPHGNPLNQILPSFETMWRVVLRTFIEVQFVTGFDQPQWRQTLIAFVNSPTRQVYEGRLTSTVASRAECHGDGRDYGRIRACSMYIVNESLRIYPPTRRVYRAYVPKGNPSQAFEIIAADLEACHLSPSIWCSDAQVFRPELWLNVTKQQRKAFMPFGQSPFECPARPKFGPQMIGILVGALLAGLDGQDQLIWSLESGDGKDLKAGVRLDTHREAFRDLRLIGQGKEPHQVGTGLPAI